MRTIARRSFYNKSVGLKRQTRKLYVNSATQKPIHKKMKKGSPDAMCHICNRRLGREFVALPCRHQFHEPCLHRWARRNEGCPTCGAPLPNMYGGWEPTGMIVRQGRNGEMSMHRENALTYYRYVRRGATNVFDVFSAPFTEE